ncbi:ATP-dependent RNA helicase [Veronia nyctiphanis]|uniref:ATP-dependent RNA helicase RhlE n=1 Tax=Veronia nyctiphanis TaxID=1278244 RepID=A0A4Q0YTV5_9GAMM|nr:DEAD/DEAH box helicase [Veronia nyctiphanis]RXJ74185.1 ATP-dependent RNA helicase [Veronia nyctiphanis]
MGFTSLGLSTPILRAVQEKGYDTPSPIQAQAIPAVLEGKDVMAAAQTGTGKTAGFTLPLIERLDNGERVKANHVRALILTPTRELAAQILENAREYSRHTRISSNVVFGGVKINPQMMMLRKGTDILVATPGRLLDLFQQNAIKFSQLETLVLDEADRMLDMGFYRDIKKILDLLPEKRQNLLFSATFSDEIRSLAKGLVNNPVEISVNPANSTARTVEQCIYPADKKKKPAMLAKLISDGDWHQVLVFSRTKHGANKLSHFLNDQGITSAPIHGNKSQGARTKALADFKSGDVRVLVATDIAARGIDIPQLPQVVNFDLPHVSEDYVHRIGRTGRAGETGKAISLVCADEAADLFNIERLIKQLLVRKDLDGFAPTNKVPESKLDTRPIKPKKPKKPKRVVTSKGASRNGGKSSEQKVSTDQNKPKRPRRNAGNTGTSQNRRNEGKAIQENTKRGNTQEKPSGKEGSSSKPNTHQRRRKPKSENPKVNWKAY